jgi:hypothetical protein
MSDFSLLLFSVDTAFIREAVAGGLAGVIVDWENIGKERRQNFADTEINHHTLADLRAVRACTSARVICRVNGVYAGTADEIDRAVDAGVDEVLVPMVRTVEEVEQVLALTRDRCAVSILVETDAAVAASAPLSRLPLARIYVGLNDLAIDRGSDTIFRAIADGTVESVRGHVKGAFGFGGLTLPEAGKPVPCRLLMAEMARLGCSFGMLRRSFRRDTVGRDVPREVERMLQTLSAITRRSAEEIERDRRALVSLIEGLEAPSVAVSRPRS